MAHIRDPKAVSPYTADEALARLIAGNDRFIKGEARFPIVQKTPASEPAHISRLLDDILSGLRDLPLASNPQQQMCMAVEANVRWSMRQILETPEAKARAVEGTMKLVGAGVRGVPTILLRAFR